MLEGDRCYEENKKCIKENLVGILFCTKYSGKAYKQGIL